MTSRTNFRRADLPPDPEGKNADRAEWAGSALRHFQCTTGTDYEDALGDLLGDLMHWCDRNNFDFEAALERARGHYEAETTDETPDQLAALVLCEDALSELARLDDGTCSISALNAARAAIRRAKTGLS
jgi:hypothetical protein